MRRTIDRILFALHLIDGYTCRNPQCGLNSAPHGHLVPKGFKGKRSVYRP